MSRRLRDPKYLVSRWGLQGNALDDIGRYPGTLVNDPTWGTFFKNDLQAIELNGNNQYVNVGDVSELNQDVADASYLFEKRIDGSNEIQIETTAGGTFIVRLSNGAAAMATLGGYPAVMPYASWSHVVIVYNGNLIGNVERLKLYANGVNQTLGYPGAVIPATTVDLVGVAATIGRTATTFDGKLHDFRLYNVALTNDEALKLMHMPLPTY